MYFERRILIFFWINCRLIGPLLLGYLEVPQKRDDGNHVAEAMAPPTLLSRKNPTNAQTTINIDMPPPSKKIKPPSLLPPPANENNEDDKNPWE